MPTFLQRPLAVLMILTSVVFCRLTTYSFMHLDDPTHLDFNVKFTPISLANTSSVLWEAPHGIYMPLTYLVWAAQAYITEKPALHNVKSITGVPKTYRYEPALFHLTNILFHLGSVYLLYLLLLHLGIAQWPAAIAVALFAWHPVQLEPVAWISALKDTLSTFLLLLTVYFYLREENHLLSRKSLFAYAGALLAKPNGVILPIILLALDFWRRNDTVRNRAQRLGPYVVLGILFAVIASQVQVVTPRLFSPPAMWLRPLVALDSIGFYWGKLFFPLPLLVDYGHAPGKALQMDGLYFRAGLGLLSWVVAAILFARRQTRPIGVGLVWFLVALIPTSGLSPFYHQKISSVADRYLYFAMPGLTLCVAHLIRPQWWKPLGAVTVGLALLTFSQVPIWTNGETALQHTVHSNPTSWLSYNNLGSLYEREDKLDLALQHYELAAKVQPTALIFNNLGVIAQHMQRYELAASYFRNGIEAEKSGIPNYHGLAVALTMQQRTPEAIEVLRLGLKIDPNFEPLQKMLRQLTSVPESQR